MSIEQPIRFAARDGYSLAGTLVAPATAPRAGLLISAGTGFPKEYYRDFAREAATRGFVSLLYDCRGIAGSAPDDLAAMRMDYTDWGHFDMPAAIDRLGEAAPGLPLLHVAHSVGGHFIGLWDNHRRIAAHLFLCVGSGYWNHHFPSARALELYFWLVHGPWSLRRHGYVKHGRAWKGANLPRGVFETWKRWCLKPRYFEDEIGRAGTGLADARFAEVTAPILSVVYSDDPIANPRTAQVMLDLYPNAPREMALRSPADYGLKNIGHNGPFGPSKAPARRELWDWLDRFAEAPDHASMARAEAR